MSDTLRFAGSVYINPMRLSYRSKFAGNEHDIRFNDTQELRLGIDVILPSMVRIGGIEKDVCNLVGRSVNKLAREIAEIFEESQEQSDERA